MEEAKQDLKSRCDILWQDLQELQLQLDSRAYADDVTVEDSLCSILKQKERQLLAEIAVLKEDLKDPDPELPPNTLLHRTLIEEDLQSDIVQLEQLLSLLRSNCEQLRQDIQREEDVRVKWTNVHSAVKEKVEEVEERLMDDIAGQHEPLSQLLEKNARLEQIHKDRVHQMLAFVQKHYPAPTKEQVKDWHKKEGAPKSRLPSINSLKSLQTILELLMNKCIETPSDAYIETDDDTIWPPYIEMMLRCGIVQRHPQNGHLLKLTAYNV